jgi:NarL family two-component system response regulator LiaR
MRSDAPVAAAGPSAAGRTAEAALPILLVDDYATLAQGFQLFLESEDDVAVVSVTGNGDSGLRVMRGDAPAMLVLDLPSPQQDLAAAVAAARQAAPNARILVWSSADHAETIVAGRRLHGRVRVLRRSVGEQIAETIRELDSDDLFVSYTPLAASYRREPEIELLVSTLSRRECDILELVTAGYSNQRIAEACLLSVHTVRAHVQSILVKLGVHSKLEAAIFALEHRLVSVHSDHGTSPRLRRA